MLDPRADNCRAFVVDTNGLVTGVELQYREMPSSKYALMLVELIDEKNAQGNTVASYIVHNDSGFPTSEPVRLAWPWPNLTNSLLSGNPNSQHMITNGYNPPEIGPLAMYVSDSSGNPISDIIGGLGLPFNRHVSYNMIWVDRNFDNPDDPINDDTDIEGDYVLMLLERIANRIDDLATHLGA